MAQDLTVGIAGLGAIGLHLARALDKGVPGLKLAAASARDHAKATANVAGFKHPPRIVSNAELAACDIVVEAAPAAVFEEIATAAIEAGRIFVPSSVGALLPRMHLVERARATGARIIVPTGALLGLDAVRAAAEGDVESVTIETRKPPRGLAGASLDTVYGDLGAIRTKPDDLLLRAELGLPDGDEQLEVWTTPNFRESVLFIPAHRKALCIEPYTCATDAANLEPKSGDAGWETLAPGGEWNGIVEFVCNKV